MSLSALQSKHCDIALLFYDYVLNLSLEIEHFWKNSRLSWPSFFFFLTRYSSLIVHVPIAFEFFSPKLSSKVGSFTSSLFALSFLIGNELDVSSSCLRRDNELTYVQQVFSSHPTSSDLLCICHRTSLRYAYEGNVLQRFDSTSCSPTGCSYSRFIRTKCPSPYLSPLPWCHCAWRVPGQ